MSLAPRIDEIQKRIAQACARAGRDPRSVHLLAVSKLQPLQAIEEAYAAGLRDFGENYVQALIERRQALAHLADIRWHLIGHLQSNKAKQALGAANVFHALDSVKLAENLARQAREAGIAQPWPVYVQVNVDGEATKSGVSPQELPAILERVRLLPELKLQGLMCIPEPREPAERMRPAFRKLAELGRGQGGGLSLSMGMSDDFEVAIEEGANWVRVGRSLFGERPARQRPEPMKN